MKSRSGKGNIMNAVLKNVMGLVILLTIINSGCARKPDVKVAYNQDQFVYSKADLLGADYEYTSESFSDGEFSSQPFDRQQTTLNALANKGVRAKLLEDVGFEPSVGVPLFFLGKNHIYMGVKGEPWFRYMWKIDGHYNFTRQTDAEGRKNQYQVKAQDGLWFDRPYFKLGSNSEALPVKPDPSLFNAVKIDQLQNKVFNWGESIPGISTANYNRIGSVYGLSDQDKVLIKVLITPSPSLKIYQVATGTNSGLKEIANLTVGFGNMDYNRDDTNNRPTSNLLQFVKGYQNSFHDDKWIRISLTEDPTIAPSGQERSGQVSFNKSDFTGCQTVDQVVDESIALALVANGASDADCFNFVFSDSNLYIQQNDKTVLVYTITSWFQPILWGDRSVEYNRTSFKLSPMPVTPDTIDELKEILAEVVDKNVLVNKEFLYLPTVVASSVNDPITGGGEQPYWRRDKVRFDFDEREDTLTVYKVKEEMDPTNKELAILKFPIVDRFDLTNTDARGEKLDGWKKSYKNDWQDRRYLKIDFSRNQILNYEDTILASSKSLGYYVGGMSEVIKEPLAKDQNNEFFFVDQGTGFMSFLTRETLTVNNRYRMEGQPLTIRIRHGFRLADGSASYVPKEVDDYDYNTFGIFRTYKYTQDPFHQDKMNNYKAYANNFNINHNKHIVYHLNEGFPEKFKPVALEVVKAWNKAFEKATGRPDVMKLNTADEKKIGDHRYNLIVHFPYNMGNGLAGFGPSLNNPDTGETLSASSFMYEGAVRSQTLYAERLFQLYVEGKTPDEIYEDSISAEVADDGSVNIKDSFANTFEEDAFQRILQSADSPLLKLEQASVILPKPANLVRDSKLKADLKRAMISNHVAMLGGEKGKSVYSQEGRQKLALSEMLESMGMSLSDQEWDMAWQGELRSKTQHNDPAFMGSCAYGAEQGGTTSYQVLKDYFSDVDLESKTSTEMAELKKSFLDYYAKRYYFDVLLHEMGHNLGLYHNFKGSTDKPNYPARYHELMATGKVEDQRKARSLRSSSVMDYNKTFEGQFYQVQMADGTQQSFSGPWDEAAIMYTYGDKLQILPNDSVADETVINSSRYTATMTRSEYKARIKDLVEQGETENVVEKVQQQLGIRPYEYCTNGDQGSDALCNTFDSGSSPGELVSEAIASYEQGYLLSYAWGSLNYDPYSSRRIERTIYLTRKVMEDFSWGDEILSNYGPQYKDLVEDILGASMDELRTAADQSFDFYKRVLLTPDYGRNQFLTLNLNTGDVKSEYLVIPRGVGKKQYASYTIEQGKLQSYTQYGILFEKIMAVNAMLIRGTSGRNILDVSTGNGTSFFSSSNYRNQVVALLNDLFSENVITEPMPFSKVGTDYVYGQDGDVQIRALLNLHPLIGAYGKALAAIYIDGQGEDTFENLTFFRTTGDKDFGLFRNDDSIVFPDPDIAGKEWEIILPKDGQSLVKGMANMAKRYSDNEAESQQSIDDISQMLQGSLTGASLTVEMIDEAVSALDQLGQSDDQERAILELKVLRQGLEQQKATVESDLFDSSFSTAYAGILTFFTNENLSSNAQLAPSMNQFLLLANKAITVGSQTKDLKAFLQQLKPLLTMWRSIMEMDAFTEAMVDDAELPAAWSQLIVYLEKLTMIYSDEALTKELVAEVSESLEKLALSPEDKVLLNAALTSLAESLSAGNQDKDSLELAAAPIAKALAISLLGESWVGPDLASRTALQKALDADDTVLMMAAIWGVLEDSAKVTTVENTQVYVDGLILLRSMVVSSGMAVDAIDQLKLEVNRSRKTIIDLVGKIKSFRALGQTLSPVGEMF